MRRDSSANSSKQKGYKMRQVDRYVKWSINTKGYIKYDELIKQVKNQDLT